MSLTYHQIHALIASESQEINTKYTRLDKEARQDWKDACKALDEKKKAEKATMMIRHAKLWSDYRDEQAASKEGTTTHNNKVRFEAVQNKLRIEHGFTSLSIDDFLTDIRARLVSMAPLYNSYGNDQPALAKMDRLEHEYRKAYTILGGDVSTLPRISVIRDETIRALSPDAQQPDELASGKTMDQLLDEAGPGVSDDPITAPSDDTSDDTNGDQQPGHSTDE